MGAVKIFLANFLMEVWSSKRNSALNFHRISDRQKFVSCAGVKF
jgi:hypothetical protein